MAESCKPNLGCSEKEIKTDIYEHCFTVTLTNGEVLTLWSTEGVVNPCGTFVISSNTQNRIVVFVNTIPSLGSPSLSPTANKLSVTSDSLNSILVQHVGSEETYQIFLRVTVHYECC